MKNEVGLVGGLAQSVLWLLIIANSLKKYYVCNKDIHTKTHTEELKCMTAASNVDM